MKYLNDYVLSICFAIIFCVVVEVLTPSERYKKIIKIVSGIFILYTLMMPVKNLLKEENYHFEAFDFSYEAPDNYKIYEEKTKAIFEKNTK